MKTLATNKDNDIFTVNGQLAIAEGRKCQTVILDTSILTQKGEMQFDKDVGIDYFGTVFVNPNYIGLWASEVRRLVESFDWVHEITEFEYKYHPDESFIEWSMSVLNTDDEKIVLGSSRERKNGSLIELRSGWANVRNRPKGIEDVLKAIERIGLAAGEKPFLSASSTNEDIKKTVNDVAIVPLSEKSEE